MASIDPQRSAVGRQLVDVVQRQAVGGEDLFGRHEREVGEVLVVDRVELLLGHQTHEVRELDGDDPARLEQKLDAGHEVVDVWHLGQYVAAQHQVGLLAGGDQLAGSPPPEQLDHSRHPAGDRRLGDVLRGIDAEHWNALGDEELQEIAVVAPQFDDAAGRVQAQTRADHVYVLVGVGKPAVGVGREVGVLGEDVLRLDVLFDLHEEATLADPDVERVERLRLV